MRYNPWLLTTMHPDALRKLIDSGKLSGEDKEAAECRLNTLDSQLIEFEKEQKEKEAAKKSSKEAEVNEVLTGIIVPKRDTPPSNQHIPYRLYRALEEKQARESLNQANLKDSKRERYYNTFDNKDKTKELILKMIKSDAKEQFGDDYQKVSDEEILRCVNLYGNEAINHGIEILSSTPTQRPLNDELIIEHFRTSCLINDLVTDIVMGDAGVCFEKEKVAKEVDVATEIEPTYDYDAKAKEMILKIIKSEAKNRFGANYQEVPNESVLRYLNLTWYDEMQHATEALTLLPHEELQKDEIITAYFQNDFIISEIIEKTLKNPDIYFTKERVPTLPFVWEDDEQSDNEVKPRDEAIDDASKHEEFSLMVEEDVEENNKKRGFFARLFNNIANFFKSIGRFFKNLFSSKKEDEAKPQRAPSVEVQNPAIKENAKSNKAHGVNMRHAKTVRFTEQSRLASTDTKSTPSKSFSARPN